MASQKLTNCCVAAIALTASTYVSTPHCSTIARLAFGAFCLAIDIDAFLRISIDGVDKDQQARIETRCGSFFMRL